MAAGHGAKESGLPDPLVLMISTHGIVPTQGEEVLKFQVPEGMTITIVNAVRGGICNYANPEFINEAARIITAYVDSKGATTVKEVAAELKAASSRLILLPQPDLQTKQFVQSWDRSYQIHHYTSGEAVPNKYYGRSPFEMTGQAFDFRMTMVNVAGQPDYMQMLQTGTLGPVTRGISKAIAEAPPLTLANIVRDLKSDVKNLIIFDFACEVLDIDDERTARSYGRTRTGGRKTRRHPRRKRKTLRRTKR